MKGWRGQDTGEKGGRDRAGAKGAGTEPELRGAGQGAAALELRFGRTSSNNLRVRISAQCSNDLAALKVPVCLSVAVPALTVDLLVGDICGSPDFSLLCVCLHPKHGPEFAHWDTGDF